MARSALSTPPPSRGVRSGGRSRVDARPRRKAGASFAPSARKLRRPGACKKVATGDGDLRALIPGKSRGAPLRPNGSAVVRPASPHKKPARVRFALLTPRCQRPNKKNKSKKPRGKAAAPAESSSGSARSGRSRRESDREAVRTAVEVAAPRLQLGLRGGDSLDDELRRFAAFVALSPREKQVRARVFRDLRATILAVFSDATVALYGSSSSGLDTFRSDLDVSVGNLSLSNLARASIAPDSSASINEDATGSDDCDNDDVGNDDDDDDGDDDDDDCASDQEQGDGDQEPSFSLNLSLPASLSRNVASPAAAPRSPYLVFQSQRMAGIELPAPIAPAAGGRRQATWNPARRRQKVRELRALQLLLKAARPRLRIKCLPKAKVPILMVEDPETRVDIDIGVNREAFASSEHGRSTSLAAQLQVALGPSFAELVAFLKEFLHQFELDKPFTGGLGSFRLYVMVASVFPAQRERRPGARQRAAAPNPSVRASDLLLRFLELFGNRKHPKHLTASTRLSLAMDPSCVVDFAGVFRLDECVETFAMAFDILSRSRTLASIIYEDRLARDRETKWRQAVDSERAAGGDSERPTAG